MNGRRVNPAVLGLLAATLALSTAAILASWHAADSHAADDPVAVFLAQHWQRPLPAQGPPPPGFTPLEASLEPRACGACHAQQFADWSTSLHSQSMGPGIFWQLRGMDRAEAESCLDCHAPLAEQKTALARALHGSTARTGARPAYVPSGFAGRGLVCAACHVRRHRRFGPPPQTPLAATGVPAAHGGFTASKAFEDSRLCSSCHQFPPDGPRLNGKLREDTYEQWQASRYAREGVTCQVCHMPDRRHLWRGIHSPGMVAKAVEVRLWVTRESPLRGQVRAVVKNVGAGHDFPTYMVPKVYVDIALVSPGGVRIEPMATRVIGWGVDIDLAHERYDTRLAPGAQLDIVQGFALPATAGWQVRLRLRVAPEEHYERVFEAVLADPVQRPPTVVQELQAALARARLAHFVALELTRPAPPALPAAGAPASRPDPRPR